MYLIALYHSMSLFFDLVLFNCWGDIMVPYNSHFNSYLHFTSKAQLFAYFQALFKLMSKLFKINALHMFYSVRRYQHKLICLISVD